MRTGASSGRGEYRGESGAASAAAHRALWNRTPGRPRGPARRGAPAQTRRHPPPAVAGHRTSALTGLSGGSWARVTQQLLPDSCVSARGAVTACHQRAGPKRIGIDTHLEARIRRAPRKYTSLHVKDRPPIIHGLGNICRPCKASAHVRSGWRLMVASMANSRRHCRCRTRGARVLSCGRTKSATSSVGGWSARRLRMVSLGKALPGGPAFRGRVREERACEVFRLRSCSAAVHGGGAWPKAFRGRSV